MLLLLSQSEFAAERWLVAWTLDARHPFRHSSTGGQISRGCIGVGTTAPRRNRCSPSLGDGSFRPMLLEKSASNSMPEKYAAEIEV
jgi:hypothetical protein